LSTHCLRLRECAKEHCEGRSGDALCIFLSTHLCICDQEASSHGTASLKALNDAFAAKMAEVYSCYKHRAIREEASKISSLWIEAFNSYMDGSASVIVLARMATAHILGDLEGVLFLNPVSRDEYDQVFDDIAHCVATTTNEAIPQETFLDQLYRLMQPVLDPARDHAIWMMRNIAWNMFEQRLRFSRG
jgi:hypothetical protein